MIGAWQLPYRSSSPHKRVPISDSNSNYKHDASDKKLDHDAGAEKAAAKTASDKHGSGPSHDPAKIARHDDAGKDRLFEHREQHDDAEKESERSRLAKDAVRHEHAPEETPGAG